MMKLPEKDRHDFKRTFLKHIQALFNFPAVDDFAGKVDMINSCLSQNGYAVEPITEKGVVVASTGNMFIELQNGLLTIRMDVVSYVGFKPFLGECDILIDLLGKVGVKTLEMVIMQKLNVYVFSKERYPNGLSMTDVERNLFSEDFIAQGLACTAGDYEKITVLAQRKFAEQESKYTATLTLTTMAQHSIPLSQTISCLEEENQMLYNMFHWTTSDRLRELMDKD